MIYFISYRILLIKIPFAYISSNGTYLYGNSFTKHHNNFKLCNISTYTYFFFNFETLIHFVQICITFQKLKFSDIFHFFKGHLLDAFFTLKLYAIFKNTLCRKPIHDLSKRCWIKTYFVSIKSINATVRKMVDESYWIAFWARLLLTGTRTMGEILVHG